MFTKLLRASRPVLVVSALLPLVASHPVPPAVALENGRSERALMIEPNRGQFAEGVAFGLRTGGTRVSFAGARVELPEFAFTFQGAADDAHLEAVEPLPGLVHYLPGSDPARWVTDVPTFGAVRRSSVYPGIDVLFRGSGGGLELEFVVAPGADVSAVVLDFGRTGTFRLDAEGQAVLTSGSEAVRIGRPSVDHGPVGALLPAGGTVAMRVEAEASVRPTRIRVAVDFLSAGTAADPARLPKVALDAAGQVFVAGTLDVAASDDPGTPRGAGRERQARGPRDLHASPPLADRTGMFVTRVSGSTVLETAWLGDDGERPLAIAALPGGDLLVAGAMSGPGGRDAFAVRLSRSGLRPVHATRIGGLGEDVARAIAVDAAGGLWLAGTTASPDLPVSTDALQPHLGGGKDAFVARLDDALQVTSLSYLGGGGADEAAALALDASGALLVAGMTESTDFPVRSPLQAAPGGGQDAFLAKIDASGALVHATWLGAAGDEAALALAVEHGGTVLLLGNRGTRDADAFLARIAADGTGVQQDSRLHAGVTALALDPSGRIWIAGTSDPAAFEGTEVDRRGPGGLADVFVARLAAETFEPLETHVLAGDREDGAGGLAVDADGAAVVAGLTRSDELPGATRTQGTSAGDAFLARVATDAPAPQGACPGTKQWTGGASGNWETAGNWSDSILPSASDDVCIQNAAVTVGAGSQNAGTLRVEGAGASLTISFGTLTIAGASEIDAPLNFNGGTLTGAGNLAISGLLTWTNGTMSGTGTTTASAGIAFSNPFAKTLTRTLVVPAGQNATFAGSGGLAINSPGVFSNAGTFEHQSDGSVSGTGTFNNAGTFQRTTSAGNAIVSCPFNNTGAVDVQNGELSLQDNGTHTGSFDATGALLRFSAGTHSLSAATSVTGSAFEVTNGTITMNGTYNVTGGTTLSFGTLTFSGNSTVTSVGALDVSNGTLTFNSGETIAPSTLSLTGGTLTGSDAIDVAGLFTFGGGTHAGTGTTTAGGGLAFTSASGKTLTRTLNHPAGQNAVFSGTGGLAINIPGMFSNAGTFEHQTNAQISGTGTFDNSGTFLRTTSAGNAIVSCPFNNTGAVDLQSGELSLQDNGTHTGSFDATGALLRFSGGTQSLSAATSVTGTAVEIDNGTITMNGTYNVTGSTTLSFGTFTFSATSTVTSVGALGVSNGTLTFNSGETIAPSTLSLTGGTLTGSDVIDVSGLFTFGGGTHAGTGTTTAGGGLAFTSASGKTLTRTLNHPAGQSAVFSGTGGLAINIPGLFSNAGTFEHQTNAQISGTGTFDNSGTFLRTTSAGNAIVSCPFNNTGAVDVQSGELSLQDNGTHTGSFDATGALLRFSGGTQSLSAATSVTGTAVEIDNGTITMNGTYNVTGSTTLSFGTFTFSSTSTVTSVGALGVSNGTLTFNSGETIAPSTLSLTGGTLTGSDVIDVSGLFTFGGGTHAGTGTTTAGGGLAFTSASGKTLTRTLNHPAGQSAVFSGTGGLAINIPGLFSNAGTFEHQTNAQISGTGTFDNSGTFLRTTSAGNAIVSCPFNNTGAVDVQSGELSLQDNGTHTGSFDATGALLRFSGGTQSLSAATSVTGTAVEIDNGTITMNGTYNVTGSTTVAFGTITFSSTSTVTSVGALGVSNGTLTFNSGEAIAPSTLSLTGGTLTGSDAIDVSGLFTFGGGTHAGTGTTTAGGGLAFTSASGKTLTRTLNHPAGQDAVFSGTGGLAITAPGTLSNAGTFEHQTNAQISGTGTFNNTGTFLRTTSAGTMAINLAFTNSGSVELLSGELSFSGPSCTQTAGSTMLNGGALAVNAPFLLQGGSLTGVGTITGSVHNSGGSVAPGQSAGTLTLVGDYIQSAGGACSIEISGLTAGTQHDQLVLTNPGFGTGDATLDGALHVTLFGGFEPVIGNTFTILTADTRGGQFATTNLPAFGCGKTWSIVYNPTTVMLEVVAEAGSADLTVTHSDAPDPAAAGDTITYTATAANGGPDAATLVTLTEVLPAGAVFVSATPSQGTCSEASGTVTCNLGTVASGASASAAIAVTVAAPGNPSATASASSAECDPTPADNTDISTSTTVLPACPDADDDDYAACSTGAACIPSAGDQCGDCDDASAARNPGEVEACDGLDNDCAGGVPANEADGDGDDFRICENDCDDGNAQVNPGVVEADPLCGDAVDNDCDGDTDLSDPSCLGVCPDADDDGYATCVASCTPDVSDQCGDCDDADGSVHPGAPEQCNGVDDDCAGGVPVDETDADTDTFRICAGDCNDGDNTIHPGATEQCNGVDDDCADGVPADESDADTDTFRICAGDCNDGDNTIHPGATEQCNGVDDDCANGVPADESDADTDTFRVCAGDCNDGDNTIHPGATEQCNGVDDDCADGVPASEADGDGDGFRICDNDCDDGNAQVNPGVVEADPLCTDAVDNDCDGDTDLNDPSCLGVCPDADDDGYAACVASCTPDVSDQCGDCDDADGSVHPGAAEQCNGLDDDCVDGVPANEADADTDTFRICAGDCNDGDNTIHPGATEQCNGVDDDCADGVPANEADADTDTFRVCAGDCNDGDNTIHPGAAEQCNGVDDDCADGVPASEADGDGDDFRICDNDCDDGNAQVNPGVVEADPLCTDAVDNDCDGDTDLNDPSCLGVCPDADDDGYAACVASCTPDVSDQCGDCDDTDGSVHPGASEQCNGVDDDCADGVPANEADGDSDGFRLCDGDCNDGDANAHPGAAEQCNGLDDDCVDGVPADESDADTDGFRVCAGDCDDGNPSIKPGVPEQCNGVDDDCAGGVPAHEADADTDTFRICDGDCDDGNGAIFPGAAEQCNGVDDDCVDGVPADEVDADGDEFRLCQNDCNDGDATVNPGVVEDDPLCGDGVDNDCDGTIDMDDPTCLGVCPDGDGDGFAVCDATCTPDTGDQCGDCNDANTAVNPGVAEQCNGEDDNCDGTVPANETDGDADGSRLCQGDCDDTDPDVKPGATEQCNGVDDDCSGGAPANEADADTDGFRICDGDCNDANASIKPDALEQCNGVDDDCSGGVPAGEADADGDGTRICAGDCNDANAAVEPGAPEQCNGVDDDCNGSVPPNEADADEDGVRLCGNDCDDDDPAVNPSVSESGTAACGDTIDNDCDGNIDLGDVGCAVTVTRCAVLGDQAVGVIDEDVWALTGAQGETLTVTLGANGAGGGRADLVLIDDMGTAVDVFRMDRSQLPSEITLSLPAAGPYRVVVKEHPVSLLLPGSPFRGPYCLTVDGSAGASQTLVPTSSVEGASTNR